MKLRKKLAPLATGSALLIAGMTAPVLAQAEISAGANVSNMYFWRGQDISDGAPAFSGSVDYKHESGAYAGIWLSSEGHAAGTETDLYVGYAGEISGVGYSAGITRYQYPEAEEDSYVVEGTPGCTVDGSGTPCTVNKNTMFIEAGKSSFEEYVLGLTYQDFSFTAYVNTDSTAFDSYKYYSFDYSIDKIGLHYGITSQKTSTAEYNDFNISYAVTDMLKVTASQASGDGVKNTKDDTIFVLSLDLPIGKM